MSKIFRTFFFLCSVHSCRTFLQQAINNATRLFVLLIFCAFWVDFYACCCFRRPPINRLVSLTNGLSSICTIRIRARISIECKLKLTTSTKQITHKVFFSARCGVCEHVVKFTEAHENQIVPTNYYKRVLPHVAKPLKIQKT